MHQRAREHERDPFCGLWVLRVPRGAPERARGGRWGVGGTKRGFEREEGLLERPRGVALGEKGEGRWGLQRKRAYREDSDLGLGVVEVAVWDGRGRARGGEDEWGCSASAGGRSVRAKGGPADCPAEAEARAREEQQQQGGGGGAGDG